MGAEPAAVGAFYRRFEHEVLGYFLARGAKPEVAADLTAETFAAVLPSRLRKRLVNAARRTLEASWAEGRVVADARRRRGMPTLVLTDESVARIAALDSRSFAPASAPSGQEEHDVRATAIDVGDFDRAAGSLRLSDAVARRGASDPDADRGAVPRIPELERDLVAAAARAPMRPWGALAVAAGLAVAVLAFVALARDGGDRSVSSPLARAPASTARPAPSSEDEIARVGNSWASSFSARRHDACVDEMTQPACERVTCNSVRGPVENCVPLPLSFRRSFRGAIVRDVVVKGRRAAARFWNGEIVEFGRIPEPGPNGPVSVWRVDVIGKKAGRIYHEARIALAGNAWAPVFAASDRRCVDHMTPPACAHVPSARFRRSFRDATVQEILVIKGRRAAARFSNGKVVAFYYVADAGGRWWIDRLGRNAGRGLLAE